MDPFTSGSEEIHNRITKNNKLLNHKHYKSQLDGYVTDTSIGEHTLYK